MADAVDALAWSKGCLIAMPVDGPLLVATPAGVQVCRPPAHAGGNLGLAIGPDGRCFASVGQDGQLRLAGVDGSEIGCGHAGTGWVDQVAWSPRGEIATACRNAVTLWSGDLRSTQILEDFPSTVAHLAYSRDGATLAVSHYGGITLVGADRTHRVLERKGSLLQLAWSPDGDWLAAATQDRSMHLRKIPTGEQCELEGFTGKIQTIAWHPSTPLVACAGGPTIHVLDCSGAGPNDRQMDMFGWDSGQVTAVTWNPCHPCLASADRDGQVVVWAYGDRAQPMCWQAPAGVTRLAWDAAGIHLAVGCADGTLAICAVSL